MDGLFLRTRTDGSSGTADFTRAGEQRMMNDRSVGGPNVQESKVAGGITSLQKWFGPVVHTITSVFLQLLDRLFNTGATDSLWRTTRKEQKESNPSSINRLFQTA